MARNLPAEAQAEARSHPVGAPAADRNLPAEARAADRNHPAEVLAADRNHPADRAVGPGAVRGAVPIPEAPLRPGADPAAGRTARPGVGPRPADSPVQPGRADVAAERSRAGPSPPERPERALHPAVGARRRP